MLITTPLYFPLITYFGGTGEGGGGSLKSISIFPIHSKIYLSIKVWRKYYSVLHFPPTQTAVFLHSQQTLDRVHAYSIDEMSLDSLHLCLQVSPLPPGNLSSNSYRCARVAGGSPSSSGPMLICSQLKHWQKLPQRHFFTIIRCSGRTQIRQKKILKSKQKHSSLVLMHYCVWGDDTSLRLIGQNMRSQRTIISLLTEM